MSNAKRVQRYATYIDFNLANSEPKHLLLQEAATCRPLTIDEVSKFINAIDGGVALKKLLYDILSTILRKMNWRGTYGKIETMLLHWGDIRNSAGFYGTEYDTFPHPHARMIELVELQSKVLQYIMIDMSPDERRRIIEEGQGDWLRTLQLIAEYIQYEIEFCTEEISDVVEEFLYNTIPEKRVQVYHKEFSSDEDTTLHSMLMGPESNWMPVIKD